MTRILEKLLVITACVSLMACTTVRTVPDWQPQGLHSGDKLTVTTKGDFKSELVFVALTTDVLQGTVGKDKKPVEISRDQITQVERREISALKTTALIGAVVLVGLIAIGLSEAAFLPGAPAY
jgi:hypothetical protein